MCYFYYLKPIINMPNTNKLGQNRLCRKYKNIDFVYMLGFTNLK